MKLYKIVAFCLIIVLFANCNNHKKQKKINAKSSLTYAMLPPEDDLPKLSEGYKKNKKSQIENFFTKNWANDFENVSFLVAKNGQIIYEKYDGFADKENNILNSPETPLHLASISKVLTASAILKLVDAQKLQLDDFLVTYFPKLPYKDVTIRMLLNHRSGIRKYGYFADDKKNWNKSENLTNAAILTILETKNINQEY